MSDAVVSLLPVIVGAAAAPLYPIIVLLLLQSQGGLRKAIAFVIGAVSIRLAQGIFFGLVFGAAAEAYPEDGSQVIASTLLLVVGILLLVTAFRKWRKQEDPDDPPPAWMTAVTGLSGVKVVGAGAVFVLVAVKQWVFTLTAIDLIQMSGLDRGANIGLYLVYTLATQTLVLIPLLAYAVAPQQSAKSLAASQAWLERNNRVIVMTVSLVFGAWFLYKGLSGLISP